ncbi:MAG: tRNA pseudouridine(55) synthase TruB [Saprospiraceae bacterium]|nr:tRNA pseudouridine(55) synthase TruB [Saprospiraceae bacterium]
MISILKQIDDRTDFTGGQLILVDKPLGWTSFNVVSKIRFAISHRLGIKKIKVGHAGTLDPLATGLVLIGVGKGTKWLTELQGLDKTYTGTLKLGATTPTYDAEMPEEDHKDTSDLTLDRVRSTAEMFTGEIEQVPPQFSAVKVDGQRAYKAARAGKKVEIKGRLVNIYDFDITHDKWPVLSFKVSCSKGTYIRSLVHDLGQKLGVGAYLTSLHRTRVGPYNIKDAWQLDELVSAIKDDPASSTQDAP